LGSSHIESVFEAVAAAANASTNSNISGGKRMPLIQVKVIENVFTPEQKGQIITKLTDANGVDRGREPAPGYVGRHRRDSQWRLEHGREGLYHRIRPRVEGREEGGLNPHYRWAGARLEARPARNFCTLGIACSILASAFSLPGTSDVSDRTDALFHPILWTEIPISTLPARSAFRGASLRPAFPRGRPAPHTQARPAKPSQFAVVVQFKPHRCHIRFLFAIEENRRYNLPALEWESDERHNNYFGRDARLLR
jgi:hypothetical protein